MKIKVKTKQDILKVFNSIDESERFLFDKDGMVFNTNMFEYCEKELNVTSTARNLNNDVVFVKENPHYWSFSMLEFISDEVKLLIVKNKLDGDYNSIQ